MSRITPQIMQKGLIIAQNGTPFRTGNARFNSLRVTPIPNGAMYQWNLSIAPYLPFLNNGTKYSTKHVGFFEKINDDLTAMLNAELNGLNYNINEASRNVSQTKANNPARQQTLRNALKNTTNYKYY
jgi:hypothetical protein